MDTVLVAGASGVVGQAAVEHFAGSGRWQVIALSRRRPDIDHGATFRHLSIDLRDASTCKAAAAELTGVTHLVYAALHELPGLVAGWREAAQMTANETMLRNLLDALGSVDKLQHVSLLQGTKAYGAHLHPIAIPAREKSPRDDHANFYWLQEDLLRARAAQQGFDFTIWRPQIVFGTALGVAMNVLPIIGIHAAICREEARPFAYTGGPPYPLEAVDARLLAHAFEWGATAKAARNETFNITNGDIFTWPHVWPAIAAALGVTPGEPSPRALAPELPGKAAVWDRIVAKHGLRPTRLADLLGESHHYLDYIFAWNAKAPPAPKLVSTIKLRQAGFADCIDTEDMFRAGFRRLVERGILPPP
ncbi:SDR family oxidoreductase [Desertibaculum subflavum]|uniref:SDR family oxidoreductase n=1 Tax=Desertibaculum subflavum TaxID=2268458 RepID=UPI000E6756E9